MDAVQQLGHAVRTRRIELRLTTEEAAARARVPETSWKLVEQGQQRPSDLMLGALCRALDWPTEELRRFRVDTHGDEPIVDLAAPEPSPEPEFLLDTTGLTRKQLYEVQDYIDYLRERFS